MTFEHLLSELLIAAIFYSIHFESVRVCVYVMVLGEQVADRVKCCNDESDHAQDDLCIRNFTSSQVHQILWHVMSHLWCTWRNTIIVFNHAIVQLRRHSNNHMIEIWIEESTFWNIMTEGRIIVISCQQVVGVVDETWWVRIGLGQLGWPHTLISTFSLMHCEIRGPDSVMDDSLSEVPFLEVISSVFLMSWMNSWSVDHLSHQLSLFETLVYK